MATIFDLTLLLLTGEQYERSKVDISTHEMKILFQEKLPYQTGDTITGTTFVWSDEFMTLVSIAMSTDSLSQMSSEEKQIWYDLVTFQDTYTYSADTSLDYGGLLPVGCTIPDEFGKSYVVLEDLSVSLTECIISDTPMLNEALIISLDAELMRILNCEPKDDVSYTEADLYSVAPCPIP